jgi:hypothetical protein
MKGKSIKYKKRVASGLQTFKKVSREVFFVDELIDLTKDNRKKA